MFPPLRWILGTLSLRLSLPHMINYHGRSKTSTTRLSKNEDAFSKLVWHFYFEAPICRPRHSTYTLMCLHAFVLPFPETPLQILQ